MTFMFFYIYCNIIIINITNVESLINIEKAKNMDIIEIQKSLRLNIKQRTYMHCKDGNLKTAFKLIKIKGVHHASKYIISLKMTQNNKKLYNDGLRN